MHRSLSFSNPSHFLYSTLCCLTMSSAGARRLRMALTILPFLMGFDGSMRTPQNICMWMLPLSISISPSSDSRVYGLRNISAISPSGGNMGLLPCGCFFGKCDASSSAISFSGSMAWMRPSSLTAKLSWYFFRKSYSVSGNDG